MKKIIFPSLFLFLLFFTDFSNAQSSSPKKWQSKILGSWKLDSIQSNHPGFKERDGKEIMKRRFRVQFNADNSIVISNDSFLFIRDSIVLVEDKARKYIFNKALFVEIKRINEQNLDVVMTEPGANFYKKEMISLYFSKTNEKPKIPDISGNWEMEIKSPYLDEDLPRRYYQVAENVSKFNLYKDGKITMKMSGKADSGTWVLNAESGIIDMKLTQKTLSTTILSLEKRPYVSTLVITNPYHNDSFIEMRKQEPVLHDNPYVLNHNMTERTKYDSMTISKMMDSLDVAKKADSMAAVQTVKQMIIGEFYPDWILKKWNLEKQVNGKDTLSPEKSVSLLLLKDKSYTMTVNNKKTSGTWKIYPNGAYIILNQKGMEDISLYTQETNEITLKTQLVMTMKLPGEKTVVKYIFK